MIHIDIDHVTDLRGNVGGWVFAIADSNAFLSTSISFSASYAKVAEPSPIVAIGIRRAVDGVRVQPTAS